MCRSARPHTVGRYVLFTISRLLSCSCLGQVWVPLATTQGGLVASVNRGCRAISEGSQGGAKAELVDDCVTKAPCIVMPDARLALELKQV